MEGLLWGRIRSESLGVVEEPGRRRGCNCKTELYCERILNLTRRNLYPIPLEQPGSLHGGRPSCLSWAIKPLNKRQQVEMGRAGSVSGLRGHRQQGPVAQGRVGTARPRCEVQGGGERRTPGWRGGAGRGGGRAGPWPSSRRPRSEPLGLEPVLQTPQVILRRKRIVEGLSRRKGQTGRWAKNLRSPWRPCGAAENGPRGGERCLPSRRCLKKL